MRTTSIRSHKYLRQPLQPPGNAKTLRQHTRCPAFFGFRGGHDVVVWVRSRAPACKCTPSPSLPSVESPLHHSVSTSVIIPQGHSMERCFTLVVRRPDRATQTARRGLLYYRYFYQPFSRQTDDYSATDAYEPDRRWPYGRLGYSTWAAKSMEPCFIHSCSCCDRRGWTSPRDTKGTFICEAVQRGSVSRP